MIILQLLALLSTSSMVVSYKTPFVIWPSLWYCFVLNPIKVNKSLNCNTFIFSQIKIFKDSGQCKILTRVSHCDLYLKGKMFYTTLFKCIIKNIHTSHANVNPKIYMTWIVKKIWQVNISDIQIHTQHWFCQNKISQNKFPTFEEVFPRIKSQLIV